MTTHTARRNQEPLYNINKTLQKVQEISDVTPLRLFKVLYPLYSISIRGTHYRSEEFEFIEKYIEEYLQACKTATAQELADFFGLRLSMVEKILRVLIAIKHVSFVQDHYELAQLGRESLSEQRKRIGDDQWGQKLLFDAYFLRPLPGILSSESKMRVLSISEAWSIANVFYRYDSYCCLSRQAPWGDHALQELQALKGEQRRAFNLPSEIDNLHSEGNELMYIPMHIVVASKHAARESTSYYLAFTHTPKLRDEFFEKLINQPQTGQLNPLQSALVAEDTIEQLYDFWEKWRRDTNATGGALEQLPNKTWRINVSARDVNSPNCKLNVRRIGSYWLEKGYFIKIWSEKEELRRAAAFENVINMIRRQNGALTIHVVQQQLDRNAKKLQTEKLSLVDLRDYAEAKSDFADIVQALDNIDENL